MLPEHILVHTATPKSYLEQQSDPEEWIEGEPGPHGGGEPTLGEPFSCLLFLPGPGGDQPNAYRPKVVREPTVLFNPVRDDDTPIIIGDEDELLIEAPELINWTGAETQRWLVAGDTQPFGPPGSVIGVMATLRLVRD